MLQTPGDNERSNRAFALHDKPIKLQSAHSSILPAIDRKNLKRVNEKVCAPEIIMQKKALL
ncbi:MAG TPA: hypothetical protein DF409_00755 [Bacteroidales bacterium]|nr:hypothetical protein [Bacteroidales bacterium]